jgi:hypothetical protein
MITDQAQTGENTMIQTIRVRNTEVEKREDHRETADLLWIVKLF